MKKKVTKSEEEWKKELTPEQYEVTRKKGTERAFTGEHYNSKEPGVYRCVACGNPLFSSKTKYESGSGWPSFWEPISAEGIRTEEDFSHGMRRVEVLCASCESHLGHLFPDGPRPTGMRFCINSAALKLEKEKQEEEKKR